MTIFNSGTVAAYVALGGSTVAVTTSDIPIPAGKAISLSIGENTYIAALTASRTATLYVYQATGGVQLE